MVDISSHFSGFGWPSENPIGIDNYVSGEKYSDHNSDSIDLRCSPARQDHTSTGEFSKFRKVGDTNKIFKKLNHNASERDRRKKMNTMYSTLRELLPPEDQSRKLSIPATISRVLKYIPELQKEMGTLIQKKESLMSKKSKRVFQEHSTIDFRKQRTRKPGCDTSALSATRISDQEIVLQISMPKFEKGSFSGALCCLEKQGFLVLSASCFRSSGGRVFYNAHIQQGRGCQIMDVSILKEKVWAFYDKGEELGLNFNQILED